MKRMFGLECVVLGQYLRQLVLIGLVVVIIMAATTGSITEAMPAAMPMVFMMSVMSMSAYDDVNDWGAYRLALPLSRRDVVLGRYVTVIAMFVGAILFSIAVIGVAWALGQAGILPPAITAYVKVDANSLRMLLIAGAAVVAIGSVLPAVALPCYFKFGSTKATQYIPVVVMLSVAALVYLMNYLSKAGALNGAEQVLLWLEAPANLAPAVLILAAVSLAILAISAAVSLRIYAKRDL